MKTLLTPTPLIACLAEDLNIVLSELPKGDYSVIGSYDAGKIDFDTTPFLKSKPNKIYQYYNYGKEGGFMFMNPNTSFLSLLHSHSLSLDKKYLIIKPKK